MYSFSSLSRHQSMNNHISRLPCFPCKLQWKVKQPMTKFRWRRKVSCSNVHLQGLMKQLGFCQSCITFLSQSHKLLFADTIFQMFIQLLVILDAHPRNGVPSLRWIIMTCPDFEVVREAQKLAARSKEVIGITTGEVTACSANVHMEERIAAE